MFRVFCLGIGILILLSGPSFAQSWLNSTQLIVSEPASGVGGASLKVTDGTMTLKNSQNVSGQGGLTAGASGVSIGVSGISATVNASYASSDFLVTQKAVYDYINYRVEVFLKDTIQNLSVKLDKLNIVGMIAAFGTATLPDGWLKCNGAAVSRTTYAVLFASIGVSFGGSDGSTTFNLPDLQGRAPIGAGAGSGLTERTIGTKLGAETHTLTESQMPSHRHFYALAEIDDGNGSGLTSGVQQRGLYSDAGNRQINSVEDTGTNGLFSTATGGGASHPTMPPSLVVKYYIRALP